MSGIYNVSNYEFLDGSEDLLEGSKIVWKSAWLPSPETQIRILAAGVHPPKTALKTISQTIKTKNTNDVVARCIKVVRDVAYRGGNPRGTVGAAAQWALIGPRREDVQCGLDVVGGRVAQEPPNIINIHARSPVAGTLSVGFGDPQRSTGMMFKDAYAYAVAEDGTRIDVAHYDPVRRRAIFLNRGVEYAALHGLHRIDSAKFVCTMTIILGVRSNAGGSKVLGNVHVRYKRMPAERAAQLGTASDPTPHTFSAIATSRNPAFNAG